MCKLFIVFEEGVYIGRVGKDGFMSKVGTIANSAVATL